MSGILQGVLASIGGAPATYIEDVFSTYLYTGNGSTQTITNGIDLAGKGGMVWTKLRDAAPTNNWVYSTAQGTGGTGLITNTTDSNTTYSTYNNIQSFNANGFTLGTATNGNQSNQNGYTYASWTFRKQPKFFDVVTYTGTGASNQNVSHNLGSVPGMMIVKRTDDVGQWYVYHRSLGNTAILKLNSTLEVDYQPIWGNTTPTSTVFTVGGGEASNTSGATYVAYLFAHDAGGFGAAGTDNVISCGSYTGNGSSTGPTVNLGYEPQYILIKGDITAGNWIVFDNMRGIPTGGSDPYLLPNSTQAEDTALGNAVDLTATGFQIKATSGQVNNNGTTYIYMAIRRPMKTPTSGTEVFSPVASSASQGTILTTGFAIDSQWAGVRAGDSDNITVIDRLRGTSTNTTESNGNFLETSNAGAENTGASASRARYWNNTGFQMPGSYSGGSMVFWNFSRRPGFFDVVCYTGTGSGVPERNHNLGVAPELMIIKSRNTADLAWVIYAAPLGNTKYLGFVGNGERTSSTMWDSTTPTSTQFFVGNNTTSNTSGATYVAYLFATCAGVSKVGSYTGTGSTQTINCGFTGGARYVMIQRTDTDGYAFYVWDTARGMVAGTDPKLALNSTAAETNANWVYTVTNGFQIVTSDATVNASGGSYIYLAIA